ncbi:HAD-IIIA family hydrolase [Candidatus Parcubacteria bacterium]|nr:HAD-IIIA family hydrolase [Candidatus Parcubacteria bacterium]
MIKQAVILAGGKGTRLGNLTKKIPKPMIKIGGTPILEHQIRLLEKYNINNITILTGYKSEIIENYVKSKKYKANVSCFKSKINIGTADRVKLIENKLKNDFLLLYGDVMLDMNFDKLINFHEQKKSSCTLVLHSNDHPQDSDLVEINEECQVTAFHSKPHKSGFYFHNMVNAGVYILSPKILKQIKSQENIELDFGKNIFPKIFKKEKIYGYNTPEYIKDMGTLERLKKVNKDYKSGKINRFNLKNKRKAIFLDRDGVINYDSDNLSNIDDFKILPRTIEAIKKINNSEYLAILVTNQPMLAKGFITFAQLDEIHKKMETLLGNEGAKLDGIYFCPHHPAKEFPGVPELRIECECRKPKPGMIMQAKKDFNIGLKNSWIIGDAERDIETGKNAKIKTILVKRNQEYFDKCAIKTKRANNLLLAVNKISK